VCLLKVGVDAKHQKYNLVSLVEGLYQALTLFFAVPPLTLLFAGWHREKSTNTPVLFCTRSDGTAAKQGPAKAGTE
jgi:hypothetical protein